MVNRIKTVSPYTLPKYCNYILSLSLSQFQKGRKKRIRKKDICIYVLSADNIVDALNTVASKTKGQNFKT